MNTLRKILSKKNLDGVIISSTPTVTYLTNFSSFSEVEREAFLLVTKKTNFIITDGRYSEAVKKQVKNFTLIEKTQQNTTKKLLADIIKQENLKKIGFEKDNLTFAEYEMLTNLPVKLHPMSLINLRVKKGKDEIAAIEKACKLGDKAFEYIGKKLKKGCSEKEIAYELEMFVKKHGGDLSFPTIVAFGTSSSVPHHQTGNAILKDGDFVLLDFGIKINNYCSDMTRTLVFGSASAEFKKMYKTVLEAQQKAIELLNKKQFNASEVDKIARKHIMRAGYPTIPHSLGHGIGIEVHEAPRLSPSSKDVLENGMVFSIEPGIYLEGFGGVRIEDLAVLENNKLRLLTHASKHLIEL